MKPEFSVKYNLSLTKHRGITLFYFKGEKLKFDVAYFALFTKKSDQK